MNAASTRRRLAEGTSLVSVLVSMVAVTAALLLPVRLAQAQPVADAGCPDPSDVSASGFARTAQTFTAENSGTLTSAQAVVANGARAGASGDYVLAINEVDDAGVPTNTVLASALVSDSEVPDNNVLTTITGDFPTPAEVGAGREYALVVHGPGDFSVGIRTGDQCPGERYSISLGTGPFVQSGAGEDLVFATFVDPFEPFTVNFVDDFADASPGDGVCDVNSFLQGDQCTLRAAIQEANANAFADTINFNIGGTGVQTIDVGSTGLRVLPEITEPLTIDGYTQPGASPNSQAVGNDAVLKIELNGTDAGFSGNGLAITASNVVIRGLVINRFGGSGLSEGNGVLIRRGVRGSRVEGNFIGVDPGGTQDLGNGFSGVFSEGANINNTVGGTSPAASNVISGNRFVGVEMIGTNNVVQGNYIGTDATGTKDLGNDNAGVVIVDSGNIVGGVEAGAGNLISGNAQQGVLVPGTNNVVQGNLIGTDATGTKDLGNGDAGLFISSSNTVGGTQDGARNVISGNDGDGVLVSTGTDNVVQGNLIGTSKDGVTPLGNSLSGVAIGPPSNFVGVTASGNLVGGTVPEAANTIASNGEDGVRVTSNSSTGNRILRNSIFSNAGLGVDLADDGPTANDFGDFDTGPNDLQNFPVLASARTAPGGSTIVEGSLRSDAEESYTLRFFSNPPNTEEGKTFVGQRSVTTNADGVGSFAFTTGAVPVGQAITATATTSGGDTSEFSEPRAVVDGVPPNTTIISGPSALTGSTSATFRFRSSEAASTFQCSLDDGAFAPCSSPKRLSNLKGGKHTFKVRARDAAGNVDPTPAARTWTVDAIKPTVTSESPRDGTSTRDRSPLIGATVRDNHTNLAKTNMQLFVDGRRITTFSYSSATDKLSFTSKKLAVGRHTVRVIARDAAGNVASRQWTFRVIG